MVASEQFCRADDAAFLQTGGTGVKPTGVSPGTRSVFPRIVRGPECDQSRSKLARGMGVYVYGCAPLGPEEF